MPRKRKTPRSIAPHKTVEETWSYVIDVYKRVRSYEGQDNVWRVKKLIKVLKADADFTYRFADTLEREDTPPRHPMLDERLRKAGLKYDPLAKATDEQVVAQVKHWITNDWFTFHSPDALRAYAQYVLSLAREHEQWLDWAQIRRKASSKGEAPGADCHRLAALRLGKDGRERRGACRAAYRRRTRPRRQER